MNQNKGRARRPEDRAAATQGQQEEGAVTANGNKKRPTAGKA